MKEVAGLRFPSSVEISFVEKNTIGETNDVYICKGKIKGRAVDFFLKVNKHPHLDLSNERIVLEELTHSNIPVPRVIFYGDDGKEFLALEVVGGYLLWDYIDPKRQMYDALKVLPYLRKYGECLAKIHNLPLKWKLQKRSRLNGLIGEEDLQEDRFRMLVSWLKDNEPTRKEQVFVHGDFNTASVLFDHDVISGVVDWEFSGTGWREYDLAWVLRARTGFLNSPDERDAIIKGYRQHSSYDEEALQWCEVLNYLHFAYWNKEIEPSYSSFALHRAQSLMIKDQGNN
jgi:aminoglycoside phosphotransferase (APT) family kinase protein